MKEGASHHDWPAIAAQLEGVYRGLGAALSGALMNSSPDFNRREPFAEHIAEHSDG